MFASYLQSQKRVSYISIISPFLRHLNTSTLAVALLVALALLSNTHGKTKKSVSDKATKTDVVIENFSFSPARFVIPVGTTVTWTNHDNVPHVVASADNHFEKSAVLKIGESFSNTFAVAGTYHYFCSIHPRMTGEIIVK